MNLLETTAVIFSAVGVWLMARRQVLCWPVSLVGIALYAWIFFSSKLYSDMLLQGFFGASAIYGWWQWKEESGAEGKVDIARPSLQETGLGILAGVAGAAALGYAMARFTDAAAPWVDSTLTSFSLVAQVWTARRFLQAWWLWITLDVVYIGLFSYKQLYQTAGLYAVFIGLCLYAVADWRRAARQ